MFKFKNNSETTYTYNSFPKNVLHNPLIYLNLLTSEDILYTVLLRVDFKSSHTFLIVNYFDQSLATDINLQTLIKEKQY